MERKPSEILALTTVGQKPELQKIFALLDELPGNLESKVDLMNFATNLLQTGAHFLSFGADSV